MIEKIKTGGNGETSKSNNNGCHRGGSDAVCRRLRRAGGEALPLRPRPAAQYRLQRRLRYVLRKTQGIEQGHHADRPVSRRAARPGTSNSAIGEGRRPRFRDRVIGEYLDDRPAGWRDVAALPVS